MHPSPQAASPRPAQSRVAYPQGVPLKLWERLVRRVGGVLVAHPRLLTALAALRTIAAWASLALLLIACLTIDRFARGVSVILATAASLAVLTLVARTRTVRARSVARTFTFGMGWALVVSAAMMLVGAVGGVSNANDGAAVGFAPFLEEVGKVAPLGLLAVLAPGRVRRFAPSDWALLAFALGAGFHATEDFVRAVMPRLGMLDMLEYVNPEPLDVNPLTSGGMMSFLGVTYFGGHAILSGLVGLGIGVGIAWWRGRPALTRPALRALAPLPALAALVLVIADHSAFNADAISLGEATTGPGVPAILTLASVVGGFGRAAPALFTTGFLTVMVWEAARRAGAGVRAGAFPPDGPASPLREVVPSSSLALPRLAVRGIGALARFTWRDVSLVVAAYGRQRGVSRAEAILRGRLVARATLWARERAVNVALPGAGPGARRRFAYFSGVVLTVTITLAAIASAHVALAVGPDVTTSDDAYLAGLLDSVGSWWDRIGPAGQILVTALVVGGIIASGGSLGLALGLAGGATWIADHDVTAHRIPDWKCHGVRHRRHRISSPKEFYTEIANAFNFGPSFGRNADALWDALTSWVEVPYRMTWLNHEISLAKMGRPIFAPSKGP